MPERLVLTEYVPTRNVELPTGVRDLLRKTFPELTISPTVGTEGRYDITPGDFRSLLRGAINTS